MIHDPQTREYAARRTAIGSSRKEILRLLKRYIARQVFAEIRRAITPANPLPHNRIDSEIGDVPQAAAAHITDTTPAQRFVTESGNETRGGASDGPQNL